MSFALVALAIQGGSNGEALSTTSGDDKRQSLVTCVDEASLVEVDKSPIDLQDMF